MTGCPPVERLVTLGGALGKLTLQIGYELFGTGQCAVGNRAHLRASSGTVPSRDHIVLDASHHRLSTGTVRAAPTNDRYQRYFRSRARMIGSLGQPCF